MSLQDRIAERIRLHGPLGVAEYMALALLDPREGYYPTRDPLGADGDFITAPEISQMFGEVLGLWVLQSWRDLGAPAPLHLVELGPGTGRMMGDVLRSLRLEPALLGRMSVNMVEASPALQAVQGRMLASSPYPVFWHDGLDAVPDGPAIILGNEYLDCLPIRQFIRRGDSWRERVVTLEGGGEGSGSPLAFAESTRGPGSLPLPPVEAGDGDLLEVRPGTAQLVDTLARRFDDAPGRALFIDYGPGDTETGDTLQALRRHTKVDPLDSPGQADLTARVDFGQLRREAEAAGLSVHGPATQAAFLSRLGLEVRAGALARANPSSQDVLARQLHRLTAPDEMGTLFKAISIGAPGQPAPLGFA